MLVAVRMAWQFMITFPIREVTRDEEARTSTRERLMLGWSGMRGGISLAAAPLQEGVDGDAQESAEAFRRLRSKLISAERETMQRCGSAATWTARCCGGSSTTSTWRSRGWRTSVD